MKGVHAKYEYTATQCMDGWCTPYLCKIGIQYFGTEYGGRRTEDGVRVGCWSLPGYLMQVIVDQGYRGIVGAAVCR